MQPLGKCVSKIEFRFTGDCGATVVEFHESWKGAKAKATKLTGGHKECQVTKVKTYRERRLDRFKKIVTSAIPIFMGFYKYDMRELPGLRNFDYSTKPH